jgi:hypothetical protein
MASWIKAKGPAVDVVAKRLASLLQQIDEEGKEADEGDEISEETFRKILSNLKETCEEEGADYPEDIFDDEYYESPLDDIDVLSEVRSVLSQADVWSSLHGVLGLEEAEAVRRILSSS